MKEIPLTRGYVALVDDDDYEALSKFKWYATTNQHGFTYAVRRSKRVLGKHYAIWMHREVLGLERGTRLFGDHVDSSKTLDNRKSNLRIATAAQNSRNARTRLDNVSGYKGVSKCVDCNRWRAQISSGGKRESIGSFATKEEAYAAFCAAAKERHGEFARIK